MWAESLTSARTIAHGDEKHGFHNRGQDPKVAAKQEAASRRQQLHAFKSGKRKHKEQPSGENPDGSAGKTKCGLCNALVVTVTWSHVLCVAKSFTGPVMCKPR